MSELQHVPDPLDARLGILIRTRRNQIGMSQPDLAKACGVTFQQVQKYESGANRVSYSRLVRIGEALKVAPAWFFEGIDLGELDPEGARAATEFWRSAEGQAIAQHAPKLDKPVRRALADFARQLAEPVEAAA